MPDSFTNPPPYMSHGVFTGTLGRLAESVVPSGPLDRHVLDGMSGADYGSLISGFKFLGLVDTDRRATAELRKLVQAYKSGPEAFRDEMTRLLGDKYQPIIGDVDLDHGTLSELEKAFREAGVSQGQMLTKSIRFFVKSMQEAGMTLSPHITKARKQTSSARRNDTPRRKPKQPPAPAIPPTTTLHQPSVTAQKPTFQVLFDLLNIDMSKEETEAIWTLLRYLKKKEGKS